MLTADPSRDEVFWTPALPVPEGVLLDRFHAYLVAKAIVPRGALPENILATAGFLIGRAPWEDETPATEPEASEEPEDYCPDDEDDVTAQVEDEEDEEPGFAEVEGRDEWPPTRAQSAEFDRDTFRRFLAWAAERQRAGLPIYREEE